MKGINLIEATELALINLYRSIGDNKVLHENTRNYMNIINDSLVKQYGGIWIDQNYFLSDSLIYRCSDDNNTFILKDEYMRHPKMLQYVMMNYPVKIVLEASKEEALNAIELSKDESNNIKRLIMKRN